MFGAYGDRTEHSHSIIAHNIDELGKQNFHQFICIMSRCTGRSFIEISCRIKELCMYFYGTFYLDHSVNVNKPNHHNVSIVYISAMAQYVIRPDVVRIPHTWERALSDFSLEVDLTACIMKYISMQKR